MKMICKIKIDIDIDIDIDQSVPCSHTPIHTS